MAAIIRIALLISVLTPCLSFAEAAKMNANIETNMGTIVVQLNLAKAPVSSQNFIRYAKSGFYDGTLFHRVIKNFMIQGGGFDTNMVKKPTRKEIKNEAKNGLLNVRGSIAMARTSAINSATSQFFINTKDNAFLNHGVRDYGYAVFGRVIKGMDVVDKISNTATQRDRPIKPVIIEHVSISAP